MGSTGFDIGDFWIRLEFFRVFSFTGTGIDIWTEFFFPEGRGILIIRFLYIQAVCQLR
jgi:hypothetical protein